MRRLIEFACDDETLVGTLDEAHAETGLLIVSGGNELRCGAHRGMALLAQRLAASGIPVFRFDRRGIGDSTGDNAGFEHSAEDIAAAASTFRAETGIGRMVAFGNCDAATALALFHKTAGVDALVLANPWIGPQSDALPSSAAIRARYAERLRDPRTIYRAITGKIDFGKAINGLRKLLSTKSKMEPLADTMASALSTDTPTTIILSRRDATALAFADAMKATPLMSKVRYIGTDSHSFARNGDMAALETILREVLAG